MNESQPSSSGKIALSLILLFLLPGIGLVVNGAKTDEALHQRLMRFEEEVPRLADRIEKLEEKP